MARPRHRQPPPSSSTRPARANATQQPQHPRRGLASSCCMPAQVLGRPTTATCHMCRCAGWVRWSPKSSATTAAPSQYSSTPHGRAHAYALSSAPLLQAPHLCASSSTVGGGAPGMVAEVLGGAWSGRGARAWAQREADDAWITGPPGFSLYAAAGARRLQAVCSGLYGLMRSCCLLGRCCCCQASRRLARLACAFTQQAFPAHVVCCCCST